MKPEERRERIGVLEARIASRAEDALRYERIAREEADAVYKREVEEALPLLYRALAEDEEELTDLEILELSESEVRELEEDLLV